MDINYELYKVFYYVATTLSFSEASRQLYISQSAVSQSVKVLEKKLGKQLFLRSTKKVQLTPEGEILLRHVEPAMNLIMRGESQLLDANPLSGGQLRIGASDTICRHFLIPYLSRFHREHPNIHIKVTNSTSIGCVDLLENGQADLIVVNYPNSRLTNLVHRKPLRTFQDVFVASRRFFDLENVSLSLKDLQNYPILMLDRKSTTSEYLHQLFQQHQLDLVPGDRTEQQRPAAGSGQHRPRHCLCPRLLPGRQKPGSVPPEHPGRTARQAARSGLSGADSPAPGRRGIHPLFLIPSQKRRTASATVSRVHTVYSCHSAGKVL